MSKAKIFLLMLTAFCLTATAGSVDNFNNFKYFDTNKLTGGNVDKEGIKSFGEAQKSGVLSSPDKTKGTAGEIGYDENNLNKNVNSLTSEETQSKILDYMSKMQSNSSKWSYRCREKRIVKIKQMWKCSLNEDVFYDSTLCDEKCMKQYQCNQANCYQTAQCEQLTGGAVCPMQKTQCQVNYTCPSGGTYNANTGKCEANPL